MNDDRSVRGLIEELSNAALRDLLRNVRHHTELRRRIAAGVVDERWVNQAYREYARRAGPGYRQRAADLTMQYYSDLTDLGNEYSERFYAEMLAEADSYGPESGNAEAGTQASRHAEPAGDASIEEIPLELHGPPGREVLARFGLENTESHEVTLSLHVGVCTGPDEASFYAPLTVQPAALTLQPGESRQVTLRLLMLRSVFVPGYLYRLPVTVSGAQQLRLNLTIWAEEPDPALGVDTAPAAEPPAPPDAEPAAVEPSAPEPVAEEPERFIVRCPECKRDFERSARTTRLYPHKTPDGEPCPARTGRARKQRS